MVEDQEPVSLTRSADHRNLAVNVICFVPTNVDLEITDGQSSCESNLFNRYPPGVNAGVSYSR